MVEGFIYKIDSYIRINFDISGFYNDLYRYVFKMSEYEKYFPDNTDAMFGLLYVRYCSSGYLNGEQYTTSVNEEQCTKYARDNKTFSFRIYKLFEQFYANCLNDFELLK